MSPRRGVGAVADREGPAEDRLPPDRGWQYFVREQRPASAASATLGALAVALLVGGSLAVISAIGWAPSETLVAAMTSRAQLAVLLAAAALGAAAVVLGAATYRTMPTRPAREGAISGAVLGAQAVVLAGLYLWFRTGAVDVFARQYFEFELLGEFGERFVRAMGNTVFLAVTGEALGIAIGVVLGIFALSTRRVVRAPARIYVNFFRGTPLLWQLTFFFFGIVLVLDVDIGVFTVAILIFGLNTGAYAAEVFRAGIQSIERGQFEAARSLGMSYFKALRLVILPQAVRRVIPPLTNEFVILIKDTSLVIVLGLTLEQQDLLTAARDIYAQTFNATPFVAAAAGYLVITLPMIRVVNMLERRLRSGMAGFAM